MRNTVLTRLFELAAAGLVVLGMAGCQTSNQGNHAEAKQRATERWTAMRSHLILEKAQDEFDTGDLDEAQRSLGQALALDKRNPKLQILAARIALERGHLERAYHLFNRAIEFDPNQHMAHYYQGMVVQRWQQFDAAVVCYAKAYDLQRDNVAYLLAWAEMLVSLDRPTEALELLTDKLNYFDTNAGIRMAIGQLHSMRGEFKKAIVMFRQAALLQPDDQSIKEELALARAAAGDAEEAIRHLETLLRDADGPYRRDLGLALANCYLMANRTTDAKRIYVKLTRMNPTDADAWMKLAQTSWVLEDLSGTLMAANRVVKLAPRRHKGYLLAGMVWNKRGRTSRALELFDQSAALDRSQTLSLILRGMTLENAGRSDSAAQAYTAALQRQPNDQRAQRLLAKIQQDH